MDTRKIVEDLDNRTQKEINRLLKIEWQSPRAAFLAGMIVGNAKRILESELSIEERWELFRVMERLPLS